MIYNMTFIPGTKLGWKLNVSGFVAGIKFHQDGYCTDAKPKRMTKKPFFRYVLDHGTKC